MFRVGSRAVYQNKVVKVIDLDLTTSTAVINLGRDNYLTVPLSQLSEVMMEGSKYNPTGNSPLNS